MQTQGAPVFLLWIFMQCGPKVVERNFVSSSWLKVTGDGASWASSFYHDHGLWVPSQLKRKILSSCRSWAEASLDLWTEKMVPLFNKTIASKPKGCDTASHGSNIWHFHTDFFESCSQVKSALWGASHSIEKLKQNNIVSSAWRGLWHLSFQNHCEEKCALEPDSIKRGVETMATEDRMEPKTQNWNCIYSSRSCCPFETAVSKCPTKNGNLFQTANDFFADIETLLWLTVFRLDRSVSPIQEIDFNTKKIFIDRLTEELP